LGGDRDGEDPGSVERERARERPQRRSRGVRPAGEHAEPFADRGAHPIGKRGVLAEPSEPGGGRIAVSWSARGLARMVLMTDVKPSPERCRFRSSYGGDQHCTDPDYHYGFCRFHFECYSRGEILANGQINEKLTDQVRRRAIKFHGLRLPTGTYVEEPNDNRSKNP